MRLDAETASPTYVENVVADAAVNERAIEANNALREGIKAAQAGDRAKARTELLRASELDPQSESSWLWLASISEYPEELVVFLNNVLDINPSNARANEWMTATKALLAKTFVQRGIDAMDGGQKGLATQYFDQALEYDQKNSTAWLWLANLAESNEGKISYLEKVLEFEPENETAQAAYEQAKRSINQALLAEARSAAVAGRKTDAHDLLDAFISVNPESEEGWVLRSHLVDSFAEKIAAFEKVLSINPDNLVARSGLDSLQAIMQTVGEFDVLSDGQEVPDAMENTARVVEDERTLVTEAAHDKSPTQDLEFPRAAYDFAERQESKRLVTTVEEPPVIENPVDNVDLAMNTVSFSFASPGGEAGPAAIASDSFEFSVIGQPGAVEAPYAEMISEHTEAEAFSDPVGFAVVEAPPEPIIDDSSVHYEMGDGFAYGPAVPEAAVFTEVHIPMPASFETEPVYQPTGFETKVVVENQTPQHSIITSLCPYCSSDNPAQAFTCENCLSTLTLSDIEMLLANNHADKNLVRNTVERLESERNTRAFSEAELTVLGIGHLNLRNFNTGYEYLQEASRLNPTNVVLTAQLHTLHIRLEEIREQEATHEAMPKGKSILVVDDSATVRKLIAGKLEKAGHEVYCAADGVEALEQIDSVIPDLILLDITMPRMDGYQVCKVIRSKDSTKEIPVVMISGKDGFFDKVRGRMAGTTGYITKPFGPETLMKAVETYLKGPHQPE